MENVLCGDIGGTHANLCIARIGKEIELLHELHGPTSQYRDFAALIDAYMARTGIIVDSACFAVAGMIKENRVKMTNADLVVDANEIIRKTSLKNVLLINDFQAVGYAINVLSPSDMKILNAGFPYKYGVRAVIGAGTGLGKSILPYSKNDSAYLPLASEGGHVDFPFHSEEEMAVGRAIIRPTYESFLSGRGLEYLYNYYQSSEYTNEAPQLGAKQISETRSDNPCSKKTFSVFVKFYARCAKNFALELMAKDGIYLAGGIAAANQDVFDEHFMEEFTLHSLPQFRELLAGIPVAVITNYKISLKGAAFAAKLLRS